MTLNMKKSTTILSMGYWFSAYTLGLLLHPYKTVRELVRRPQFGPMIVTPLVVWLFVWATGVVAFRFGWVVFYLLDLLIGVGETPEWFMGGLAFVFWWMSWFLLLWQGLVGYLWVRFRSVNS